MAKIHTLEIKNFRGIRSFKQVFGQKDFVCLIGRGNSGKTTILHAISAVLSPNWNYNFFDTDFYNLNIDEPIIIEASLYDITPELLSETKYGLYKRVLNNKNEIKDDLLDDDTAETIDILTLRLQVNKDLEPKWYVINNRNESNFIEIKASDRAKLNSFLLSDYFDRQFSWSKGNPLYSLLKREGSTEEKDDVIINAFRDAKLNIDNSSFKHLDSTLDKLKETALGFGVDISNISTSIDFKDISISDGKVCLHDENIPFRLKGKGTKRLLSIAIQMELAKSGGIILIDEIEQGLEPDRVRFLSKILKEKNKGQVFITTHSNNVIVELAAEDLYLMRNTAIELKTFGNEFQGCLRKNAEAFFAKRILICEGATEIGICRALNDYRISKGNSSFSILGICIVDGHGVSFVSYCKRFKEAGYDVCIMCDSDDKSINKEKESLREYGINIIDCEKDLHIESQLFKDLPWPAVQKLINYAIINRSEESIKSSVESHYSGKLPHNWKEIESVDIRNSLAKSSVNKEKAWFKDITHGEVIGGIWFDTIPQITGKHLYKEFLDLNHWIDNA